MVTFEEVRTIAGIIGITGLILYLGSFILVMHGFQILDIEVAHRALTVFEYAFWGAVIGTCCIVFVVVTERA